MKWPDLPEAIPHRFLRTRTHPRTQPFPVQLSIDAKPAFFSTGESSLSVDAPTSGIINKNVALFFIMQSK